MLGKPGSGKGTQSVRIAERLGLMHISPGLVLRDMSTHDSFVGRGIQQLLQQGQLVPDGLILWLIQDCLSQESAEKGSVFDGFPRNFDQAKLMETVFNDLERTLTVVFDIQISDACVLERITGRRVCEKDYKHTYHMIFNPPKNSDICDVCGGKLLQRTDDTQESVMKRLEVYSEQTYPLLDYYKAQGLLCEVDGERSIDEIAQDLEALTNTLVANLAHE